MPVCSGCVQLLPSLVLVGTSWALVGTRLFLVDATSAGCLVRSTVQSGTSAVRYDFVCGSSPGDPCTHTDSVMPVNVSSSEHWINTLVLVSLPYSHSLCCHARTRCVQSLPNHLLGIKTARCTSCTRYLRFSSLTQLSVESVRSESDLTFQFLI